MNALHYIGFDVHKKTISFCVKTAAGEIVEEGSMPARRAEVRQWAGARAQPWRGAQQAAQFADSRRGYIARRQQIAAHQVGDGAGVDRVALLLARATHSPF